MQGARCRVQVASCRLQVAGSRLHVARCTLQVAGCRFNGKTRARMIKQRSCNDNMDSGLAGFNGKTRARMINMGVPRNPKHRVAFRRPDGCTKPERG